MTSSLNKFLLFGKFSFHKPWRMNIKNCDKTYLASKHNPAQSKFQNCYSVPCISLFNQISLNLQVYTPGEIHYKSSYASKRRKSSIEQVLSWVYLAWSNITIFHSGFLFAFPAASPEKPHNQIPRQFLHLQRKCFHYFGFNIFLEFHFLVERILSDCEFWVNLYGFVLLFVSVKNYFAH